MEVGPSLVPETVCGSELGVEYPSVPVRRRVHPNGARAGRLAPGASRWARASLSVSGRAASESKLPVIVLKTISLLELGGSTAPETHGILEFSGHRVEPGSAGHLDVSSGLAPGATGCTRPFQVAFDGALHAVQHVTKQTHVQKLRENFSNSVKMQNLSGAAISIKCSFRAC